MVQRPRRSSVKFRPTKRRTSVTIAHVPRFWPPDIVESSAGQATANLYLELICAIASGVISGEHSDDNAALDSYLGSIQTSTEVHTLLGMRSHQAFALNMRLKLEWPGPEC